MMLTPVRHCRCLRNRFSPVYPPASVTEEATIARTGSLTIDPAPPAPLGFAAAPPGVVSFPDRDPVPNPDRDPALVLFVIEKKIQIQSHQEQSQ